MLRSMGSPVRHRQSIFKHRMQTSLYTDPCARAEVPPGITRRTFLKAAAGGGALLAGCETTTQEPPRTVPASAAGSGALYALPPTEPLRHLVKRTSFGVSAADWQRAQALGADRWLAEQLAPASLADPTDALVKERYPVTQSSRAEISPKRADQTFLKEVISQTRDAASLRACYSPRQLYELMVEFWSNHFNVLGPELHVYKLLEDREVIRLHALGRFADLLHASAKSPAMLIYLDNNSNTRKGPNENYARELMELHTLGVNGGYTEDDVHEVARCFTGWTVNPDTLEFVFQTGNHDDQPKTVLGQAITAGGQGDAEQVLDLLAQHPSTAHFIATKLCWRFVADTPPAILVARVAQVFTNTSGDIPSVLRAILTSAEFRAAAGAKLARPMEYVASCVRAVAPDPARYYADTTPSQALAVLGQSPFEWGPPNGYPDTAAFWMSTAGLIERWRFAASLAETRNNGQSHGGELAGGAVTPTEIVDAVSARLLIAALRPDHRAALITLAAGSGDADDVLTPSQRQGCAEIVTGALLASPYYLVR